MLKEDIPETFAKMLGFPESLITEIGDLNLERLMEVGDYLEQGKVAQADNILFELKDRIPAFELVKNALIRHYIGNINSELHQVMDNPKLRVAPKQANPDQYVAQKYNTYLRTHINLDDEISEKHREIIENEKKLVNPRALTSLGASEARGINKYTGYPYERIQASLRNGVLPSETSQHKLNGETFNTVKNATSGLNKLPPYVGEVYRNLGLFPGYKELNQVGATVSDMGFLSTTFRAESVRVWGNAKVLEIIKSKSGKFIKPFSDKADENEVLFKPGTRFKVTKRFDLAASGGLAKEAELAENEEEQRYVEDEEEEQRREEAQAEQRLAPLDSYTRNIFNKLKFSLNEKVQIVVFKEEV